MNLSTWIPRIYIFNMRNCYTRYFYNTDMVVQNLHLLAAVDEKLQRLWAKMVSEVPKISLYYAHFRVTWTSILILILEKTRYFFEIPALCVCPL
jgi:hypothetical protein